MAQTSKLSVIEILDLAKSNYSKGSYENARDYFLAAKRQSNSHETELGILDSLAAVHEKLGDFEKSLQYGREVIQTDPSNAKGYLRVSKTLAKSGKPAYEAKILPICARGISKVTTNDPQLPLLRKFHDGYARKANPPQSLDPFDYLPLEMSYQILGYLTFAQLVTLLSVSKRWKAFLTSQPILWREMDFESKSKGKKRHIPKTAVKNYIRNSQYTLRVARLGQFDHVPTIVTLIKLCKQLHTLSFDAHNSSLGSRLGEICSSAQALRTITVTGLQQYPDIYLVLEKQANANEIHLLDIQFQISTATLDLPEQSFPNLKVLEMTVNSQSPPMLVRDDVFFSRIVAPRLEKVILDQVTFSRPFDFTNCAGLRSLELRRVHCGSTDRIVLPQTITTLKIKDSGGFRLMLVGSAEPGEDSLPNLEELHYERCRHGPEILEQMLSGWSDQRGTGLGSTILVPQPRSQEPTKSFLKVLKIEGCDWETSTSAARQIFRHVNDYNDVLSHPRLSKLESLIIGSYEVDDGTMDIISTNCTNLKRVGIKDGKVTGVGIKKLVTTQKDTLKQIALTDCETVSEDTYTWVRSQGIKIWSLREKSREPGRWSMIRD